MAVAEFAAGMTGIKAALDIVQSIRNSLDPTISKAQIVDFQDALIKAQNGLIDANLSHMAQIQRVHDLEEKVRNFETWDTEKQRYDLKGTGFGSFAYMLKPDARGSKPPHWVCTNCFDNKKISVLQYTHPPTGRMKWLCPACKAAIEPNPNEPKWID